MALNGRNTEVETPTIVVVEEDASLRRSLSFSLAAQGFAVRAYANADELLSLAELPNRGCLVLDDKLSDMNGLDLVAALRRRAVALPIILVATNPSLTMRRRAAQAGVPMIEKPLLGDSLLNGILAALNRLSGEAPSA